MSTRQRLIADCQRLLEQGLALLELVDDELYAKPEPAVSSSGIGSHLRHCIDYFDRLLEDAGRELIDYDRRRRDERLERSRAAARRKLLELRESLPRLGGFPERVVLRVKQDAGEGDRDAPWSRSSLERELQFLNSHAVHHFALIAVILRLNGVEPEDGFGVAPSTLRYWKENGLVHGELDPSR